MTRNITAGTLYSGSGGNCTLVRTGDTAVLIDAGRSAKRLTESLAALGIPPERISGIFITHSHIDHVSALRVFTKRYETPVHAAGCTAAEIAELCAPGTLVPHKPLYSVEIGNVSVHSFPTMHDTGCPVGYRVTVNGDTSDAVSVGIATDLGCVTEDVMNGLRGCAAVVLESNHDIGMLMTGPYPPAMKRRILSRLGHLSNEDSARLAALLARDGTRAILLAHISKINNRPDLALSCAGEALCCCGCRAELRAASPDSTVLLDGLW